MAEDIVEDVGLLQIVELLAAADEGSGRKLAVGQHLEEGPRRDEPRHRDDFPAGDRRSRAFIRSKFGTPSAPMPSASRPSRYSWHTWPLRIRCWRSNSVRQMA